MVMHPSQGKGPLDFYSRIPILSTHNQMNKQANFQEQSLVKMKANFQVQSPKKMKFVDKFSSKSFVDVHEMYDNERVKPSPEVNASKVQEQRDKNNGPWTLQEDRMLAELVKHFGPRWAHIGKLMKGRLGKQCRERWHNSLRPHIKKTPWTQEEEHLFIEGHMMFGNSWAKISKMILGRSENNIKNHWYATKRKVELSRKKSNGSNRRMSVLENYIASTNYDANKWQKSDQSESCTAASSSAGHVNLSNDENGAVVDDCDTELRLGLWSSEKHEEVKELDLLKNFGP